MAIITQTGGQSTAVVNGQSIDFIAQQVIQALPAVPDNVAGTALQNTIRDFYYKSAGWRETIGPYFLTAGKNVIQLNPVDQYSQCHLLYDLFVFPDFTGGLTPRYLNPAARQKFGGDVGPATQYYMDGPTTAILYPALDRAYGNILYAYMSLMPVINAGRLPDISITHHFDGLLYGTMWRLCTMQNKPWTVKDMTLLNEWRRIYRREILVARDMATRGYGRADGPQVFPNFAGRYSQSPHAAGGASF